jgi:hypothetical protein
VFGKAAGLAELYALAACSFVLVDGCHLAGLLPGLVIGGGPRSGAGNASAFQGRSLGRIAGREPVRMHPSDAEVRGLRDGDLVRIFNDRGACLAGLSVDDAVRPGVVQLSTGAWYDPDPADPGFCRHGNPNVLTADLPSSSLSQGCTGQLALVEVEGYRGTPPELTVSRPPATA